MANNTMRPIPGPRGWFSTAICTGQHPKDQRLCKRTNDSSTDRLGFKPGELVGSVSGELGLRSYIEKLGHELVVISDKDGANSKFEKHLPDVEVVISQPFWPAYLTPERIAKAKKLKLALTAGIGSDHVDLEAAARNHITVAEVTGSNSRTCCDDGAVAGAQLSAVARICRQGWLEHR
jgi:hypothetical protein